MDNTQLTDRVVDLEKITSRHSAEIKTLFATQKSIEKLTDSTHSLAVSVEKLTNKVSDVDERLDCIEGEKKQKGFAMWQIVVSTILGTGLGALVSMAIARMMGG